MVRAHRLFAAGVLAAGVWVATPACATGFYGYGTYGGPRDYRDIQRVAYDNGYREGFKHGSKDGRHNRDFRIDRDGDYRSADDGYRREYGDREFYRMTFRRGYETGYRDGYARETGYACYPGYGRPLPPPPVYPAPGGGYPGGGPGVYSLAARNGYRDGFDAGKDAAHDGRPFDPIREKRYREGDHDYDSRYGPRDEYKRDYRAAFQQGYEEGYRTSRR